MINRLKALWTTSKEPQMEVDVAVDHIELADTYLMLGLNVGWQHEMVETVTVQEVQLRLYDKGRRDDPTRFYYQGNFVRVVGQKAITKTNGTRSFILPTGQTHVEGIRFYTRAILNLEEGTYPAEIHTTTPEGTFIHEVRVPIANRIKYRTCEAWTTEANLV